MGDEIAKATQTIQNRLAKVDMVPFAAAWIKALKEPPVKIEASQQEKFSPKTVKEGQFFNVNCVRYPVAKNCFEILLCDRKRFRLLMANKWRFSLVTTRTMR